MEEITQSGVQGITLSGLQAAIVCLLGVFALLVAINKGIEAFDRLFLHRDKAYKEALERRLGRIEDKLEAHDDGLGRGDKRFERLSSDVEQLLNVNNALLMHMITGNGIEGLKQTKNDLDQYLSTRRKG